MLSRTKPQVINRTSPVISFLLLLALIVTCIYAPALGVQEVAQRAAAPAAPTPSPAPSPAASPAAATTASATSAPRTVEDLRPRIQEVLRRPELAPAQFAVKVASLDTGRVLYEENAGKLLMPASNMKIYTVATALARLTPGYRFKTSIYAPARPDSTGVQVYRGEKVSQQKFEKKEPGNASSTPRR